MDANKLEDILIALSQGKLSAKEAFAELKTLTFDDLGFAKTDAHRASRQGIPEVIFGPGKTAPQIAKIAESLLNHHQIVVATKIDPAVAEQVLTTLPGGRYETIPRMLIFGSEPPLDQTFAGFAVSVVTAGTADLPVAEEAALYLAASGVHVNRSYDIGVAGIHRIYPSLDQLKQSRVVIVVAGMDGALASVLGGLLSVPVIAVPTSVGYGASFQGLSPLLAMLNSCAAGLTVVNIDNGFGAAVAALRILRVLRTTLSTEDATGL